MSQKWPASRLKEALAVFLAGWESEGPALESGPVSMAEVGEWLESQLRDLGLTTGKHWLIASAEDLPEPGEHPALLVCETDGELSFLLVVERRRHRFLAVTPTGERRWMDIAEVISELLPERSAQGLATLLGVLERSGLSKKGRDRVRMSYASWSELPRGSAGVWSVGTVSSASPWQKLKAAGFVGTVSKLLSAHLLQHVLLLSSWWILAGVVLADRSSPAWVVLWALLLGSVTPFRAAEVSLLATATVTVGRVVRQRLLDSALSEPEDAKESMGLGRALGALFEAESLETYALGGAHIGLIALLEVALGAGLLAFGLTPGLHLFLLGVAVCSVVLSGREAFKTRLEWTRSHALVAKDAVEKVVGSTTRRVQEDESCHHLEEDHRLARLTRKTDRLDRSEVRLKSVIPRAWLALALLLSVADYGANRDGLVIAATVGGILFVYRALWKLVRGVEDLSRAAASWQSIASGFARSEARPHLSRLSESQERPVLRAHGISHRFGSRAVLRDCSIVIEKGERILLSGESGSGKSTLVSALAGNLVPEEGTVVASGFEVRSMPPAVRRRTVALVPQFHRNHLLTGSLAYNLLIGGRWPASVFDLRQAERVCRSLGLGDLLDRMPAGIHQLVGESGWRLSHGERSRVFVARGLLQGPRLLVLDESLSGLDPATAETVLSALENVDGALVLVTH